MKNAIYKSYDELPLFLNAEMVAKLLGVSPCKKRLIGTICTDL